VGEPLAPGSVIHGRAPTDAGTLFGQAGDILPMVQQSLDAIRRLAERLERTAPQLEAGAREFADLGRAIREAVPEVRRTNDELRLLIQNTRLLGPGLRRTNEELQVTLRTFGQAAEQVNVLLAANQDKIVRAVDQVTDVLQRLSNVLSEENQKNFTATLRAVQASSANFDSVVRNTDEFLKEGRKTSVRLQESLNQLDMVMANLNQATKPLAERGERIVRNLDASLDQINRTLGGLGEALAPVGRGEGTIQKFLTDPSLYNNLNAAACMITRTLPRVDRILSDVEVFADKIARHPESIGLGGAVRPSAGLKEAPSSGPPAHRPFP
jgi:ABC-type transporter Mla subunit MlaD